MKLDKWQKQVLETKGNICLRSGRQVGKSTIISIKAAEYALNNDDKTVMVIASVERQAIHIFLMILNYIEENDADMIKGRPTLSFIGLENGSKIFCFPTGEYGHGIRGYTVDLLIADEAAFIGDRVWTSITPMLAVTRGSIWLLSTPHGREGYFYRAFTDSNFTKFHVSSEDCPRKDMEFLKREKERMSKLEYAQEYLGEFCEDLIQFIPDWLIEKCQNVKRRTKMLENRDYFLGVDVARMGADESTFEIIDRTDKKKLVQVENQVTTKTLTTDTTRNILSLNEKYDFKRIYIDDGGMGVGVFDQLLEEEATRRKVVPINNASRSQDRDKWKTKLMKEDLYNNLLRLMERGEIALLEDSDIFTSLKSLQYEYEGGRMKIFGSYTHIAEGLIRAAWCVKDKSLNIYCY